MSQLIGTDYETQKINNINSLKQKYESKLAEYKSAYNTYYIMKFDTSTNKEAKRLEAETTWSPKVASLNTELNNILNEVKKNIMDTEQLINKQKTEVDTKTKLIYDKNQLIESQDNEIKKRNNELMSKDRQIQFTLERNRYRRIIMISLIATNVALIGGGALWYMKNKGVSTPSPTA